MTLTEMRTAIKEAGFPTNIDIDRVDVKREFGAIVGLNLMFENGNVAYVPVAQEEPLPPAEEEEPLPAAEEETS